jgi:hypothetical protein
VSENEREMSRKTTNASLNNLPASPSHRQQLDLPRRGEHLTGLAEPSAPLTNRWGARTSSRQQSSRFAIDT